MGWVKLTCEHGQRLRSADVCKLLNICYLNIKLYINKKTFAEIVCVSRYMQLLEVYWWSYDDWELSLPFKTRLSFF